MPESTAEHCLRHTTKDQVCGACYRAIKTRLECLTEELEELPQWFKSLIVNYGEKKSNDMPEQH